MKQGKIISAYKVLVMLNRVPGLPFSMCNKLFMMKRKLEPYYQSQLEQENIILEANINILIRLSNNLIIV